MTYHHRLTQARTKLGLTQEQVAAAAGVSRTQYVSMEGGAIPTPDRWRSVILALELSEEDYLADMTEEQREKALDENRRGRRNPRPAAELGRVGFLKNPEAGVSKRKVICKMPDDSMEPAFMKGDEVWVESLEPARAGDLVAIVQPDGECLVRRLVRLDDARDEAVVEDLKTRTMARVPVVGGDAEEPGSVIYRVV